jgi:sugar phosphate isomerase/epimerase
MGSVLARSKVIMNPAPSTIQDICIFSKHLQWLDFAQMAETAAALGFDGVDLTVRPGGHVPPEKVTSLLPAAVKAVKAAGLRVPMMATGITDSSDPLTEQVLATAAEHGVRHYRLGYYRYSDTEDPGKSLTHIRSKLAGLAKLNEKHRITGNYQNHAGKNYFGASIWDLWAAMKDLDPRWIGSQFDLRHATVEGAMNWPVDFRMVSRWVGSIVIKDFYWTGDRNRPIENCPLGQGVTRFPDFLPILKASGFAGPVSVHYEYPLGGANNGGRELALPRKTVLEAMKKDLETLKSWLADAGLS